MSQYAKELEAAIEVARGAMEIVLGYYYDHFDVEIKSDNSPVTNADLASNKYIYETLKEKFPTHGFLTEEMADNEERLTKEYIWVIDPIDGTKDFIRKDDQFCINIALVKEHTPVVGVVAVPVSGDIYYAIKGEGAHLLKKDGSITKIHVSDRKRDLIMLSSVCHQDPREVEIFSKHKDVIKEIKQVGSALKSCLIASGVADMTFRFSSGSKEWDICAPQIVLEEAGGVVMTGKQEPITYNKVDVYNHDGFFMMSSKELVKLVD